ncbi:MAG: hypothetical protein ACTHJ0_17385, partial [Flavipsychrobacter sp.]
DKKTGKRILPAFYSDNYVSILPGEKQTINIGFNKEKKMNAVVTIEGWNVPAQTIKIEK